MNEKSMPVKMARPNCKQSAKIRIASFLDFTLVGLALLSMAALVLLGSQSILLSALRIPLGLAFVLFIPGYSLQAALFPSQSELDWPERLALSFGLSLAVIPLIALLLDNLSWGISLRPVVIAEGFITATCSLGAILRRSRLPEPGRQRPVISIHVRGWWTSLDRQERVLHAVLAGTLLSAAFSAAAILVLPSSAGFYTEFYMLGPGGLAEDYPREARAGQPVQVTLGVANLEQGDHNYRLETWAVDPWSEGRRQLVAQTESFPLDRGARREAPLAWQMPWPGDDQQAEFQLLIDGGLKPYRTLRLWLDVVGPAQ
jgi:uncharacterized membrane protein